MSEKAKELRNILDNAAWHMSNESWKRWAKEALAELEQSEPKNLPKVICLCGSTRFTEQMLIKQWELTKKGFVVLSWCALPESYTKESHIGDIEGVKEIVDEVHKRKIDLADEIFVLNINGYVGESTKSEIEYAIKTNKKVNYME